MDWLFQSRYNLDFFLAAIPLQVIMIVYYLGRRHLLISESRSFLYLMVLNLSTLVTDIMACGVTVKGTPATVLYFWNILYFACFLLTASGFLLYTADALHIPRFAGDMKGGCIPACVGDAFIPFHHPLDGIFLCLFAGSAL